MNPFGQLLEVLKERTGIHQNGKAGRLLDLEPAVTSNSRENLRTRESWWRKRFASFWDEAYSRGRNAGRQEVLDRLLDALLEIHLVENQSDIAKAFGVTPAAVSHWRKGIACPSKNNIKTLLRGRARLRIVPIAEYHSINPVRRSQNWWIDADKEERASWRAYLTDHAGIYLFYDSSGSVTYIGKTSSDLFVEIEQRLGSAKLRGTHFWRNLKKRSERGNAICQGEVARFLSVYVLYDEDAIHNIEALMIRGLMNDHANRNKGRFKN